VRSQGRAAGLTGSCAQSVMGDWSGGPMRDENPSVETVGQQFLVIAIIAIAYM
jgi:hypothetical protein